MSEAPISEPLRAAASESGSARALALEAGIDPATLHRFLHGRPIRIDQADRLAVVLGLELKAEKRKRKTNG